jgi:16S rRNA processing protein RimM
MSAENHRRIGKLIKLHGIHGEAVLIADTIFPKKFEKTEWLFLLIDGLPVPFFVSEITVRTESSAVIKLADVHSSEEMEEFIGYEVAIQESKKKRRSSKSLETIKDIKGYVVIDSQHGEIGIAKTILNYQENYLLQLFKGTKEILIPVHEQTITDIDDNTKTIFVNTPEGLLDL